MPIYTYRCEKCKHESEELQKMGADPPEACSKCESEGTLERTMGLSSFQLKGGGWYADGY
jgi:putative FmdB family regulatory protein